MLEAQQTEIKALRDENQPLRDEIKRLKGEKGQPKFKASGQTSQDVSSESEPRKRRRQRKSPTIHAQVLILHFAGHMTQSRIHGWLSQLGIKI